MESSACEATIDWLLARVDLPRSRGMKAKVWELTDAWDSARTNDQELFDHAIERDRLIELAAMRKNEPASAFQNAMALADDGSVCAMLIVSRCYFSGIGVSPDAAEAEKWYRLAAEHGSQVAQLSYGKHLASLGDFSGCEAVFRVGASERWPPALFWLAWARLKRSQSRRTYAEVQPLLECAAAEGSPAAQWILARNMSLGRFGVRQIPRGLKLMFDFGGTVMRNVKGESSGLSTVSVHRSA